MLYRQRWGLCTLHRIESRELAEVHRPVLQYGPCQRRIPQAGGGTRHFRTTKACDRTN